MALSKREMKILWLTVAVAGTYVLYTWGIAPLYDSYITTRDELEMEEAKYQSNVDKLARADSIEEDYRRIEATFPKEDPEKDPRHSFSEDVDAAAAAILPDARKEIKPVNEDDIKGVDGYELLTLEMTIVGELPKLATLLKGFDQKGFLIKSIRITHFKGVDNKDLKLDITLARIVKVEEEEEQSGRRRPGSRRLRSGGRLR
jgi:hypothetical protein